MKRTRIWSIVLLAILLLLTACDTGVAPTQTPVTGGAPAGGTQSTATAGTSGTTATATIATTGSTGQTGGTAGTLNGVKLPDDAAPPDQQVFIVHYDNTADFTTVDFYELVYKRGGAISDILSDSSCAWTRTSRSNPAQQPRGK